MRNSGNAGNLTNFGNYDGMNQRQVGQLINNQAINALSNNSDLLNQILNPSQMNHFLEKYPDVRRILQDPQMKQLLLNPQFLQGLVEGLGSENPFAGKSRDLSYLKNIVFSQEPNTRLGELFSQWMNEHRNGGSSNSYRTLPKNQALPSRGQSNVDYKEIYKQQITKIREIGIDDEEKIIEVLKKCNGDIQLALDRLIS